jgi:hypothetical protein
MLQTLDTNPEFEALARAFLAKHSGIRHEWRQVRSAWSGGRTDLLCEPGGSREVFASLTGGHVTVGTSEARTDFEDFGRGLSNQQLAEEAFAQFVVLLQEKGIFRVGE